MTITFITALIDLEEPTRSKNGNKSVQTYLELFKELILGVPSLRIIVFLSTSYFEIFHYHLSTLSNHDQDRMRVIEVDLHRSWTYQQTEPYTLLPRYRTVDHDTRNFLITQNSKIEWLGKGMDLDPWKTTHFGWIDFGIVHVFRDKMTTLQRIEDICTRPIVSDCIILPGCLPPTMYELVLDHVVWRFCGGMILGDSNSLLQFIQVNKYWYTRILSETKTITWEVNLWAFIELIYRSNRNVHINWFQADHNDTIVQLPERFFLKE